MKKMIALLTAGMLLAVSAAAGETADHRVISPKEAVWDGTPEGEYCFGLKDTDHAEDGYFTMSLYAQDLYDRDAIENMKPGDQVIVHGKTYTAAGIRIHGMYDTDGDGDPDTGSVFVKDPDGKLRDVMESRELTDEGDFSEAPDSFVLTSYELVTEEEFDGYIAFEPVSGTECRGLVNDASPCTFLGDVTIRLPLPDRFVFLDAEDNEGDVQAFLDDMSEDWYSPYNSYARFEGGELVEVSHSDYPAGIEDD